MNTKPEELNLDEAFLEPEDMEGFVNRALFRDAEFSVKRIGGTPEDPKFTYHTLNFKGPNWFGWIRIVVIGKAWREQAAQWFTISVFARRLDGPMFMSQNERNTTAVDLGKDFHYGKIKELPTPESLYPYLEAALDENQEMFQGFEVTSDEDIDKVVYWISLSIIHLLKGAHILNEAIDPDEFMSPVINQGGFRPMRWKLFKGQVARGNENWYQEQYILPVTSFDDKIYGSIVFSIDYDNPDDAKAGDGMNRCSANFNLHTGSYTKHRQHKAVHLRDVHRHKWQGGESPMFWIPPSNSEAWLEASFRAKPEWIPKIKKCYELLVTKYWRPLIDQRDDQGNPMLKQNEEALRKEFMDVFKHQNEIGESISLTPGEFEEFGEVASDIQYASSWHKANGGINNRFIDLWACDLACPLEHPFTGYLTVYKSSEDPFILHVGIRDGYTRGKYIIGYFKAEPSERILDKVRAAALQQIKAYMAGEDFPGNSIAIANQFAAAIQSHISGDPEVLSLNYTERTNESIDMEDFVDDFLTREGIGPWKDNVVVFSEEHNVQVNTGFNFKFDNLMGLITFIDYQFKEKRYQSVGIHIIDSFSGTDYRRNVSNADENPRWHINVTDDQIEAMKEALVRFIGGKVRNYNRAARAEGSSLLPKYERTITRQLLNTLMPWNIRESLINPEEIGDEFIAHSGPPFEWKDISTEGQKRYLLSIRWLDNSHFAYIALAYVPELGERTWNAHLTINALDPEDRQYHDERLKINSLVMLTPKTMPQAQARIEEFAKLLIKTFSQDNPVMPGHGWTKDNRTGYEQFNWIKQQFDMATNWTGLKEMLEPEEFLSDFDVQGVMRPWETNDYRETATMHPHIHHRVIIEHPDRTRPFNDKVEINVDYFLSHETVTGMPSEPFVLITGSYAHRGWSAKEMKAITVKYKTDKDVLPVVDQMARHYLLPKIAKNRSTSGSFAYFRRKLASRMAENGWIVEAFISGQNKPLQAFSKYWLDRDGQFHQVEDHEEVDLLFPEDGWERNYNTNVEIDYKYQEAIKRGFVRVTTDNVKVYFNPPATDLQRRVLIQAAMEVRLALVADYGNRGERIIWQPVQEALNLTFRSECVGAYSGQTNMVLYAELDGQAVGRIEYSVYNGEVYVQFIKTQPGHRRQGIATALAKQLQSEYPDTEIEWSASTEDGTQFIASLNREFEPEPNYDLLKKAYDDAKAERDGLQKEFDAWIAAGKGKLPPEMLMKGERMNEIETFLWDLEDKMRDLKPGRWMIRENLDPEAFYKGYEDDSALVGWVGQDMNTSTSGGAYLHVNKGGVFGPVTFNLYMRPNDRMYASPEFDASFQLSSWAQARTTEYQGSAECPDIWIRLSPTKGRPSFQPDNIDAFMADVKQGCLDFVRRGCQYSDPTAIHQTATAMFILLYNRLKKKGWKMDVDKHGGHWDLEDKRFQEGLEWTPDDMADIARKATAAWGEWQAVPFETPHGGTGTDWIFKIQAPEGKLYQDNNWIRIRFHDKEPDKDVILGGLSAHFVSVNPYYAQASVHTPEYLHVDFDKQFIIKPGEEEDFRKAVEAEFHRTIGKAVLNTPANRFSLTQLEQRIKMGYTRLIRRFWPPGAVWM